MVADEVMAGFGRTGRWFAVDHWDVVPDLMTMAKGLTSSYLPLGAVAMRHEHRRALRDRDVLRRPDLLEPPGQLRRGGREHRGLRGGRAARERRRASARSCAAPPAPGGKHPSVGAVRNLGLFGILDLVRSREPLTPLTPFNGTIDEMKAIGKFLRDNGLYTMIANNSIHTNPPLCITEEQLAEGFEIIDRALDIADQAVDGASPMATTAVATGRIRRSPSRPRPLGRRRRGRGVRAAPRRSWSSGRASSSSAATPGGTGALPGTPVDLESAVPLAVRQRPECCRTSGTSLLAFGQPAQPGRDNASAQNLFEAGLYTLACGGDRVRVRGAARARPCDRVRPLAAARAGVRAVRRRQPDRPDHRARAADRLRVRARTACRSSSSRRT